MKNILVLILIVVSSCSNESERIMLPDLSKVNSVKLTFKTDFDSSGKIILKNVNVTEPIDIKAIKNSISEKPFNYQYCISSGSMAFFKDTIKIIELVFNTTPDFRHIAYNYKNKLIAFALSEENAKLLESFKN